jgi:hypothetical protein
VDPQRLDTVLESVLTLDPDRNFDLALSEPIPWPEQSSLDTREVDQLLREAEHRGLLDGERAEGDGSISWWTGVDLTVAGLRQLGQWPPLGGEHLPGPWDGGRWGGLDRPLLADLAAKPPRGDFIFGPAGGDSADERQRWRAALRLLEAGLIDGGRQQDGIDGVRITVEGQRTLQGPQASLDRATVELRRGAKADAMTAVVEEALAELLRELAQAEGLATEKSGRAVALGNLNDQLQSAGVFDRVTHAEVELCLGVRNETNHGRGADVSETRIERAIAIVDELQGRHRMKSP